MTSGLHLALAAAFALAAATPALWRVDARIARALGAIVPATMTAYFVTIAPGILDGRPERAAVPWAPSLGLHLALSVDGLGLLFALLVCGIGSLVLLYAGTYLDGDAQHPRFTAILLLFLGSMLGLVLADDLYLLYVFWGLTGLSSWLLIGFDHGRSSARAGAGQAFLVTMAGELAMLAGFVLLAGIAGTTRISELPAAADVIRADPLYPAVLVLVLAGAMTKSAQLPFHFWLPNAMEAPTPVSAYLHSATMVKAGVYLLARLAPVLAATDAWVVLVTGIGAATLLVGGWMSLGQTDLKRILAYSTIAALGMMVLLLGLNNPAATGAAVTVLLAHAGYKGALFLVAGVLDRETGTRDVTRLGGLARAMPLTATAGLVAAASMTGLPGLLGFVGKELAYKATIGLDAFAAPVSATVVAAGIVFVAVAGITGARPFVGHPGSPPRSPHEAPPALWIGPVVLAGLALAAGIAPGLLAGPLVGAATADVVGGPVTMELLPFYPPDAALALSVVSVVGGIVLFAFRDSTRRLVAGLDPGPRLGAEAVWEAAVAGMARLAVGLTASIQGGRLRRYILVVVLTATSLAWIVLAVREGLPSIVPSSDLRFWEIAVAGAILVGALVAVLTDSRLSAIAALGVVGYGVALVYLLFGAPDLAMTQILIETLTIILFVLVFYHLPRFATFPGRAYKVRDAVIALAAGALMGSLVLSTSVGPHDPISGFFVLGSAPEAFGRNIVNVILVDFRAIDTLGEIAVLALSGVGVLALLKLRARRDPEHRADP